MFSSLRRTNQTINKFQLKGSFSELNFTNTAIKVLPVEENEINTSHKVRGYNFSKVNPTPKDNPCIVSLSAPALELLDLDKERVEKDPDTVLYISGNKPIPGSEPVAQCYCGHQFGGFSGQLGDGRAITLGDIRNQKGELWELQFKGAGQTPYSRFSDGLAVLRSSIREYLCSEAMWALGIPTTRAASLIVSDTLAKRDPLYTGKTIMEKCAVVLRLAPTLWRFGTFEIFKKADPYTGREGSSAGLEGKMLKPMLDYMLLNHFPEIAKLETEKGYSREECYLEMFYEIVRRTAYLFALWQCYGFCHGVLSTDNMSVLGLTIDYGPYGWLDYFDKGHICNHSDEHGRYSYQNQPEIGKWNLIKLAEALQSELPLQKAKGFVEQEYDTIFKQHYYGRMREKLGLYCVESEEDTELIDSLFEVMQDNASDFTNTFRNLSHVRIPHSDSESLITSELVEEFVGFSPSQDVIAARYKPHYSETQLQRIKQISRGNAELLMMLGLSPSIIKQEEEKMEKYQAIINIDEQENKKNIRGKWEQWLKKYETRLFKETAAASQMEVENKASNFKIRFSSIEELQEYRIKRMNKTNPLYILRNYMAEEAIKKAENGDFSGVNNLLESLLNPFDVKEENYESKEYKKCPPRWAADICVSCSS